MRHWLRGGRSGEIAADKVELANRLRAMAVPEHLVQVQCGRTESFAVWPENWSALAVFVALSTQWTFTAPGLGAPSPLGLHYPSVPVVMDMQGVPPLERADTFWAVQVLEAEAIRAMREKGKRDGR